MIRTTLRTGCWLILLFWSTAGAIYYGTHQGKTDLALVSFLHPSQECPSPCWEGIRPGITDSLEAVDKLRAIPWVTDIYAIQGIVTNDSYVRWRWKGQFPAHVDAERYGQMWFHNGIVYAIDLPLTVSFSNVWGAFGAPEIEIALKAPLTQPQIFYHALYFDKTLEITGTVKCPLNAHNLLSTPVDAHISISSDKVLMSALSSHLLC